MEIESKLKIHQNTLKSQRTDTLLNSIEEEAVDTDDTLQVIYRPLAYIPSSLRPQSSLVKSKKLNERLRKVHFKGLLTKKQPKQNINELVIAPKKRRIKEKLNETQSSEQRLFVTHFTNEKLKNLDKMQENSENPFLEAESQTVNNLNFIYFNKNKGYNDSCWTREQKKRIDSQFLFGISRKDRPTTAFTNFNSNKGLVKSTTRVYSVVPTYSNTSHVNDVLKTRFTLEQTEPGRARRVHNNKLRYLSATRQNNRPLSSRPRPNTAMQPKFI